MTKLGFGLIASSLLFASSGLAQNADHARHHPTQARQQKPMPRQGMNCCCMPAGMMSMPGMSGMQGMRPMPGMPVNNAQGMPPPMTPPPMAGMMGGQMMADMQAQDQKLQDLVKAMNEAPQDSKLDAAIAVINEMTAQHAAMKKMMMEHMGQMRGMSPGAPNRVAPPAGQQRK